MYVLLLTILFSIGTADANFFEKTQQRWASAVSIDLKDDFNTEEPIDFPPNIDLVLGEIVYLDFEMGGQVDCLLYKYEKEKSEGHLKVIRRKIQDRCEDYFLEDSGLSISQIRNFAISYKKRKLTIFIDKKKLKYELYNILTKKKYKLFDTPKINTKVPGVLISFVDQKNGKKLNEGEICFDIDDSCSVVQKDLCFLCPGKVTEVIASSCKTSYRKYCLSQTCGEKGKPACIRGYQATRYKLNYCLPGSPVGFCKKPLKVFCENGELICR